MRRDDVTISPGGTPTVLHTKPSVTSSQPVKRIVTEPLFGPVTSPVAVSETHLIVAPDTVSNVVAPLVAVNGIGEGMNSGNAADAEAAADALRASTAIQQSPSLLMRVISTDSFSMVVGRHRRVRSERPERIRERSDAIPPDSSDRAAGRQSVAPTPHPGIRSPAPTTLPGASPLVNPVQRMSEA